jgi:eukaryotic-like serine/threonine-protein kinase
VYALGVVLYEALTGRLPWPVHDREGIFAAHAHLSPDPLPHIPGLPVDVAVLIERALAKDPAARPTAADLAHRLAAAAGVRVAVADAPAVAMGTRPGVPSVSGGTRIMLASPLTVEPAEEDWTPPPRRVVPLSWAAAAAVLLSLVVAAVVAIAVGSGDQPRTQAAPPASASAAPTTPSVPARTACGVHYDTDANDGGVDIEITIVNTGTTQINGWTLMFDLKSGGVRLGDTRNGRWSLANGRVTVRSLDQNAAIAPGATVASRPTASLNGRGGRRDRVPERFTLNGTNCQILDTA